jgi:hypothetical protein
MLLLNRKACRIVEVWRYDPFLLSNDKYVDDLSLVLSLKDEPDERVQKETVFITASIMYCCFHLTP